MRADKEPPRTLSRAVALYADYVEVVGNIIATFHDATHGFARSRLELIQNQERAIAEFSRTDPTIASMEYMDARRFGYAEGPPTRPPSNPVVKIFHIGAEY